MDADKYSVLVDHCAETEGDQGDVLAFTDILRSQGVQATVDLYHKTNPPLNWNVWLGEKASAADFLLLIMSQSMYLRLSSSSNSDPDVQIVQSVVFGSDRNKVIPIFLNQPVNESLVPLTLRGISNYKIDINYTGSEPTVVENEFYIALYARLTKQSQQAPPLGVITHYSHEQIEDARQRVEIFRARNRQRQVGSDQTDSGFQWCTGPVTRDAGARAPLARVFADDLSSHLHTGEYLKGQGSDFSNPSVGLSHRPDTIIGREYEIESMKKMLSPESLVDSVGLFGSAGSGKSETAKEVAMQLRVAHPFLQVVVIDMQLCKTNDTWAAHFLEKISGLPATNQTTATEDLQSYIRANVKNSLLLIDNCECASDQITSFIDFLASLLGGGTGKIKCLVISQRRFFIHRRGINMKLLQWGSLHNADATMLFIRTAEGKCSEEDASEISSLCGNIPLTIKGAASMVGAGCISSSDLLRDLRTKDIVQVLEFADSDVSLTLMLKTSFERWSRCELEAFVSLCVLPGSFSPHFASAVLHPASRKTKETIWTLANIQQLENGQYKLHRVYREFGLCLAKKIAPDVFGPILEGAKKAFLSACSQMMEELSEEFEQDVVKVRNKFSEERHNFRQFMTDATCIPEGLEAMYISAALYCPFLLDTFVSADERIKFYERCVEAASAVGSRSDECQLRYWLAQDLIGEGFIGKARSCISDADQLFEQLNEQNADQNRSLQGLRQYTSSLLLNRGERDKHAAAVSCFQQAVISFVNLQTMQLQQSVVIPMFLCGSLGIRSLTECSTSLSRAGDSSDRSILFANASLVLCDQLRKSESHPDRLVCLNSLAIAQMSKGQFQEAYETFEKAVKIQKNLTKNHRDVAILLSNAAQCLAKMGKYSEAGVKFTESFDMLKELYDDQHKETLRSRYELAVNDQKCGNDESALEHYRHIRSAVENFDATDRQALDFSLDVVTNQVCRLEQKLQGHFDFTFLFSGASNQ